MNYYNYLKSVVCLLFIVLSVWSCRDEFDSEIIIPQVINQPPSIADINDLTLVPGFGAFDLDLATYIYDQEGDIITYQATNSTESVISTSLNGSILTISEVGDGVSTIGITATDGNEGHEVTSSFEVNVKPILGASDVETDYIMFDFNGFGNQDLYDFNIPGVVLEFANSDWDGAYVGVNEIFNDHTLLTIDVDDTQIWYEAELEGGNQDFTGKKMRLDYKFFAFPTLTGTDWDDDSSAKDIYLYFVDETWGEAGGRYFLSNLNLEFSTEWQTIEIPLADFESLWGLPVDASTVGVIGMHLYGGGPSSPLTIRIDNFGIVD